VSYRFKAGEDVPENIRRIVSEEIDFALEQLHIKEPKKRDEAIHEARKSVKKIRGVLKLIRPELGRVYRDENDALRDAGRKLSELRDAGAIIETFDSIVQKHSASLRKNGLSSIRKALGQSKQAKEHSENIAKVMSQASLALATIRKRVPDWPVASNGFFAVAAGLEDTYRRGRRAMRQARSDDRPELFHEWRKRAKDHWYHVRLLESCWTEIMQARESSLHDLETWLGDDHNIVVLAQQIQDQPEHYGNSQDVGLFLTLAQAQQKELRGNALSLGERIYEEKPARFVADIRNLWNAWQDQPDSMKQQQKLQRKSSGKNTARARQSAA
jgi:CHAD domain-containing protein